MTYVEALARGSAETRAFAARNPCLGLPRARVAAVLAAAFVAHPDLSPSDVDTIIAEQVKRHIERVEARIAEEEV